MRAATVVQQLCKSCRTCFKFYCMFYFTCDAPLMSCLQTLMFPNQDHGRMSVSEDGTLTIEPVLRDDAGQFICKGLSIAGSAYAKARLDVRG